MQNGKLQIIYFLYYVSSVCLLIRPNSANGCLVSLLLLITAAPSLDVSSSLLPFQDGRKR